MEEENKGQTEGFCTIYKTRSRITYLSFCFICLIFARRQNGAVGYGKYTLCNSYMLSPPDFDLFPKLKKPLRGKRFRNIEVVSNEVT
jgi:hypothetical protein